MNTITHSKAVVLAFLFFISFTTLAQDRSCGMVEYMNEQMQNPEFVKEYEKNQAKFRAALANNLSSNNTTFNRLNPIIIPVAVHFPSGNESDRACLEALAQNQIDILNADFTATNSDATLWNSASSNYPGVNHGVANIEFCIATQNHPANTDAELAEGSPAVTIGYNFGNGNDFDSNWAGYMNFLVKNIGGSTLGYSPLGGSIAAGQSVVINTFAFGSGSGCSGSGVVPANGYDLGRTVTHELGHFYNLNHTWGSNPGSCNGDDGIADTPNISGPNYGCSTPGSIAGCVSGESALTMSYMDYGDDVCLYMFTEGQTDVVDAYINVLQNQFKPNTISCGSTDPDFFLVSNTEGAIYSCPTVGDDVVFDFSFTTVNGFNTNVTFSATGQPAGSTVTFSAASLNSDADFTMTVGNISNTTEGDYEITVTGSYGFITKSVTVDLNNNCTSIQCETSNSAENLGLAIPDGTGPNVYGPEVTSTLTVADLGTISSLNVNVDITHSYISDLVVALYHPDQTTYAILWGRECDSEDGFDVTFDDEGSSISCANPTVGTYVPYEALSVFDGMATAGDWELVIIDGYNGDLGNLNDWSIEFCTESSLSTPDTSMSFENVTIYPNPNNGSFTLKLQSATANEIKVNIFDIRGRKIYNNTFDNNTNFKQTIELGSVQSGMYLMTVSDGSKQTTKRLIIE
mgnify:FL=1